MEQLPNPDYTRSTDQQGPFTATGHFPLPPQAQPSTSDQTGIAPFLTRIFTTITQTEPFQNHADLASSLPESYTAQARQQGNIGRNSTSQALERGWIEFFKLRRLLEHNIPRSLQRMVSVSDVTEPSLSHEQTTQEQDITSSSNIPMATVLIPFQPQIVDSVPQLPQNTSVTDVRRFLRAEFRIRNIVENSLGTRIRSSLSCRPATLKLYERSCLILATIEREVLPTLLKAIRDASSESRPEEAEARMDVDHNNAETNQSPQQQNSEVSNNEGGVNSGIQNNNHPANIGPPSHVHVRIEPIAIRVRAEPPFRIPMNLPFPFSNGRPQQGQQDQVQQQPQQPQQQTSSLQISTPPTQPTQQESTPQNQPQEPNTSQQTNQQHINAHYAQHFAALNQMRQGRNVNVIGMPPNVNVIGMPPNVNVTGMPPNSSSGTLNSSTATTPESTVSSSGGNNSVMTRQITQCRVYFEVPAHLVSQSHVDELRALIIAQFNNMIPSLPLESPAWARGPPENNQQRDNTGTSPEVSIQSSQMGQPAVQNIPSDTVTPDIVAHNDENSVSNAEVDNTEITAMSEDQKNKSDSHEQGQLSDLMQEVSRRLPDSVSRSLQEAIDGSDQSFGDLDQLWAD